MKSILSGTVIEPRERVRMTFGLPRATRFESLHVRAEYEPKCEGPGVHPAERDVAIRAIEEIHGAGVGEPWLLAVSFLSLNASRSIRVAVIVEFGSLVDPESER